MERGEIWWADLPPPSGRRPVLLLSRNEAYSVREFVEAAFSVLDHSIEWRGQGPDERGIDTITGQVVVRVDPELFRPIDRPQSWGDSAKALSVLGWRPTVDFESLVQLMVEAELEEERPAW